MKRIATGVLALGAAVCAAASDGRIPIGTAPYTITAPGSYYLTADLSASATVIDVSVSNVTLDLNGHTITNSGSTATIYAGGATNLTIFGGNVVGGGYGVYIGSATAGVIALHQLRITGFTVAGVDIQGGSQYPAIRITDNDISSYGTAGTSAQAIVAFQVWGGRVSSNTLMGQTPSGSGTGISFGSASGLLLVDNSITYYQTGISLSFSDGVKLLRNDVFSNGAGIAVSSCTGVEAQENLISSNSGTGLSFSSVTGCVYRSNTSQLNGTNYSIPGSGVTNAGGNY